MRLKHWVGLGFAVVGLLFLIHVFTAHQGQSAFLSGIGLGGLGKAG